MLINRLRFDRAYGRLQDEEGLSLVELMVSLIIVGAVLSALASTIVASLRAITKNQREARAIALQTEMVERFQAIPWGDVGIYRPSGGGPHPWDGDNDDLDDRLGELVVDLGPEPDTAVARFLPQAVEVRGEGDFEYTVESHVVWVSRDAEPATNPDDFESKRVVVFVTWEDTDGTTREIQIAAERSPPPTAVGFVDQQDDQDGDNVADANDNCPFTGNSDQVESSGPSDVIDAYPPGVGQACDADSDGHPEEDRNGDGRIEDPCPGDPSNTCTPASAPVINSFAVNKENADGSFATQNRICVSSNDATSADHRVRVSVSNLASTSGTVTVTYWYWKGNEDTAPPTNSDDIQAVFVSGNDSQAFYDAVIPRNTGKFRPDLDTGLDVVATNDVGSDSDDNRFTLPIEIC